MSLNHRARWALIFNPAANHSRSHSAYHAALDVLRQKVEIEPLQTNAPGHAITLARSVAEQSFDGVIAMGGDGTVNEVVNGLMAVPQPQRPTFGVIPCGSGNDFAYACGLLPGNIPALAERAVSGKVRPVDIGSISAPGLGRRFFDNSVGMFIVAAIGIRAQRMTRLHGSAMYLTATIGSILHDYDSVPVTLTLDGETVERDLMMLSIGNGPREGGGFLTNPPALNNDGMLNYMCASSMPRSTMLRLLPLIMFGKQVEHRLVTMGTAKQMRIEARDPVPVHVDGEIWARPEDKVMSFEITVLPNALNVVS